MNTADQKDRIDQDVAHRRLLSAVVVLAIRDSCSASGNRINEHARSGVDFLFEHSDGYLELLDINPKQFKERLLTAILNNKESSKDEMIAGLSYIDRERFAQNYRKWWKDKSSVYERQENEHNKYH